MQEETPLSLRQSLEANFTRKELKAAMKKLKTEYRHCELRNLILHVLQSQDVLFPSSWQIQGIPRLPRVVSLLNLQ